MRACWISLGVTFALAIGVVGAPLLALTTTTIVADVVRAVAGSDVEVTALFPPGADPHSFQASPQDVIAIETADVVFLSGAGLEAALEPVLAAAQGRVVDVSADLLLRTASEDGVDAPDPHVWFDPRNVIEWARNIAAALSELIPEQAEDFAQRAALYEAALADLDAWIQGTVGILPDEARLLVTDHESFGYFAARYGFAQVGSVFPGTSTLAEPSARDLASLEDAIRALGVRAVFVGTRVTTTLAEQVAADTGARIVFLYTGSLSESDGPAPTYLDLMRYDVEQIVHALLPTP